MIRKVFIAMMVVLMVSSVAAAMELEDVKVPETFEAGDQLLVLNGAGVRNVFLNDVYVSGLWLENPSTDGNAIAAADEPMAIRIHVLNDFFASSKNISNAFTKGFRYALPKGDLTPVKEELDRLLAAFSDEITDGEEFDIVYIPGKGTSIYKEGVLKDTIPGLEFKKLLFGIWISDKATVNDDLKEGMLAGKASPEAIAAKEQWIAKMKVEKEEMMADAKATESAVKAKAAAEAKAAEEATMAAKAKAAEEAKVMEMAAAEKAKAAEKAAMKVAADEKAMAAAEAKVAKEETMKAAATAEEIAGMALTKDTFGDQDVFFGVNSAALSAKAKKTLDAKAKWMKSNPLASVSVKVTCDSRGSKAYNMALAKKREKSVVNYMVGAGIDPSRLEMVIAGEVESAAAKDAWANNRRAHFSIK